MHQLTPIPIRERLRLDRMRHRAPRYICARIQQLLYERSHPAAPWLTPQAIRLDSMLPPSDHGLEFGSGRSTIWFARRVSRLIDVEHDPAWYEVLSDQLKKQSLGNVDYILARCDRAADFGGGTEYARAALAFAGSSLDLALIDGVDRDYTARYALPAVKPGGMLIIDNVNWFLPSRSRSPASRTPALGPDGEIWTPIASKLARWRCIWTNSGVWDTAIYVKPGDPPAADRERACT